MKKTLCVSACFLLISLSFGNGMAQETIIYPAQGQTQEQLDKDKGECFTWAKQQTGFDPMQQPQATAPPPQQQSSKGKIMRGGAKGALLGVTAGVITGNPRKGAKIGAATGTFAGGVRKLDQQKKQDQTNQQYAQQEASNYAQTRDEYNRASSACLEGRGYSVK